MKKNLITVVILALVLANLVLTAILAFTIIPQTQKSNKLIDQISSAINLELESGDDADASAIPIADIEVYNIEEKFQITLKDDGDGKDNIAIFSVGLSVNSESESYSDDTLTDLKAKETLIQDQINMIAQKYTLAEFRADGQQAVKDEILKALQEMYGKDLIVGVSFSGVNSQ